MHRLTAKVFLIFLLATGTALSQDFHVYGFSMYNLEMLGSGARARAMGGAFLGVSDDASALTWTPAGLIQISKTQASISGSVVRLKTENDYRFGSRPDQNFLGSYTKDLLNLASGSFVAPVRIKGHAFVGAASYQRVIDDNDDFYSKQDFLYTFAAGDFFGASYDEWSDRTQSIRNLHKFALGFGTGIYGDLSFGGAVNIFYGNGRAEFSGGLDDTMPLTYGGTLFDTLNVRWVSRVEDNQSSSALNLTGSLMYRTEKVRVGVTLQSPFELVTDHDIKRADTLYRKSITVPGQGTPSSGRPTLYVGRTKIDVPLSIGLGTSIQVTPKLLVAADIELRSSGKSTYFVRSEEKPENSADSINIFTIPTSIYYKDSTESSYFDASGDRVEIYDEFNLGYESSMQFRFGLEYMLPTSIGTIPLRGGVRYTQLPYRNVSDLVRDGYQQVYDGFVLGDKLHRTSFSFGSGIRWSQIWLEFAVELNKEEQEESGYQFQTFEVMDYVNTKTKTVPSFQMSFTGFF